MIDIKYISAVQSTGISTGEFVVYVFSVHSLTNVRLQMHINSVLMGQIHVQYIHYSKSGDKHYTEVQLPFIKLVL